MMGKKKKKLQFLCDLYRHSKQAIEIDGEERGGGSGGGGGCEMRVVEED